MNIINFLYLLDKKFLRITMQYFLYTQFNIKEAKLIVKINGIKI